MSSQATNHDLQIISAVLVDVLNEMDVSVSWATRRLFELVESGVTDYHSLKKTLLEDGNGLRQ